MLKSTSLTNNMFDELRVLLEDLQLDDYYQSEGYLLRWLQFTNYDVHKAAIALRKSREWQQLNNIESTVDEDFKDLSQRFPVDMTEVDKKGRLVIKVFCQEINVKGLDLCVEGKRLLRYAYWLQLKIEQRLKEQYYEAEEKSSQCVAIVDCTGMSDVVKQIGICKLCTVICLVKQLASNLETNFPRGIQLTCVINAPKLFSMFYTAIKPFFCSETMKGFQVHGSDSTFNWREEL